MIEIMRQPTHYSILSSFTPLRGCSSTHIPTTTSCLYHPPFLEHQASTEQSKYQIPTPQTHTHTHTQRPNNTFLCYICNKIHRTAHTFSLVGSLIHGSSKESGQSILLLFQWGCNPLQLLQSFPQGVQGSVQRLTVSICICLSQVRAEPLRGQPFQAPIYKHIMAFAIVLGFSVNSWDGSQGWVFSGWLFPQSLLHFFPAFPSQCPVTETELQRYINLFSLSLEWPVF